VVGGRSAVDGHRVTTVVSAAEGEWAALVVAVDGVLPAEPAGLVELLEEATAAADRGLARARLPRHHPERAADALAVLEACTFEATGAPVAAPTTSLPEAPGGDRQFDYRYSWLRDASLAISVASLLGRRETAERYLDFVHGLADGGRPPAHPVSTIHGDAVPAERIVDGVRGWAASAPVRVGNEAGAQRQLDAFGFLLEGISTYVQTGGRLDDRTWRLVQSVADTVAATGREPTSGIWELRRPMDLVVGDIGRWLALDRAIWIARGWRPRARRRRWKGARDEARARVLGALRADGSLPQAFGPAGADADASSLMVVIFGMLSRRDRRAGQLLDATLDRLGAGPFLYRYDGGPGDGFCGQEGAFVPVCWWAVSALAAVGRVDEARRLAGRLDGVLPRLLSEEVDSVSGESLGNAPLVWSHAEAAGAMYVLDAAVLRRRFGPAGLWAWRIGRYLRLRWGRHAG
jgi:GH15 family glucan-1,4-alpha-glucosidase